MTKPRVLFRVEGNDQVGHGHFMRCLTMARYLKDALTCEFAMSAPSDLVKQQLIEFGLKLHNTPWKEQFHPDDKRSTADWKFDLQGLLTTDDLLIVDGYRFDDSFVHASHQIGAKVIQVLDAFDSPVHGDGVITQLPLNTQEASQLSSVPVWSGLNGFMIRPEFYDGNDTEIPKEFDIFTYITSQINLNFIKGEFQAGGKKICALASPDLATQCQALGWTTMVSPSLQVLISAMRRSYTGFLPASTIAIEYFVATRRKPYVMALADNQKWGMQKFIHAGMWIGLQQPKTNREDGTNHKTILDNPQSQFVNWIHARI